MAGLKSLAKDTAIYGLSSIVGRFLNYMLVPLYTAVLPASTGGYGVVSNVYAFTALMLVLLTFGMETGFFRFANKSGEDPMKVYANSLLSVGGVSLIFVLLCLLFLQPISNLLDYSDHPEFIAMMAVVVALDSFQCIPFAYLRYKKRPVKFAAIKLLSIIGGIGLNLFFLLVCPWLNVHCPATISWFYDPDYLVGYIFISNLIISVVQMFFFIPELTGFAYKLDRVLLKRMVVYSFPVLILGLVGILNQTVDKMIYPFLFDRRRGGETDIQEQRVLIIHVKLDTLPFVFSLDISQISVIEIISRRRVRDIMRIAQISVAARSIQVIHEIDPVMALRYWNRHIRIIRFTQLRQMTQRITVNNLFIPLGQPLIDRIHQGYLCNQTCILCF